MARVGLACVQAALLLLAGSALVGTAHAQWPAEGRQFCEGDSCLGVHNTYVHRDGTGGAIILWERNSGIYGMGAQRIRRDGTLSPGWPANGRTVTTVQSTAYPSSCPDGSGGTFIVWTDVRPGVDLFAQHLGADSRPAPGWPDNGVRLFTAPGSQRTYLSACTSDGQGGFFVVWQDTRSTTSYDIYAHRFRADGTPFPGWPATGVPVVTDPLGQEVPALAPDGSGGIFIVWGDYRGSMYLHHLLSDGSRAPGFPVDGKLLASIPGSNFYNATSAPPQPDGAGGLFLLGGKEIVSTGEYEFYMLRVQADGSISPGWLPGGLPVPITVGIPGEQYNGTYAADGAGGVYVTWTDNRDYATTGADFYAMRLLADGSRAPGFPATGVKVTSSPGSQYGGPMIGDGVGGVYLSYEERDRVRAQHLGPNGLPSPGWTSAGRALATSAAFQSARGICSDDIGGAYVALESGGDGIGYIQRLVPDGLVATLASLISSSATSERVGLIWSAPTLPSTFIVERRDADAPEWRVLGEASFLSGDRLEYNDDTVQPGGSYFYRLSYSADGSPLTSTETWVKVPSIAAFALAGAIPNPARAADLRVRFSLPDAEPARISLIDLNGRRVVEQSVAGGAMGVRDIAMRPAGTVRPGLYWLVLEHGAQRATTRVTVLE